MKTRSLLKDGKESTEFKITKYIIVAGVVYLILSKLSLISISPDEVKSFASTIRSNADEYIGALMILGSAGMYIFKRCILKINEMKQLVALAEIDAIAESEVDENGEPEFIRKKSMRSYR